MRIAIIGTGYVGLVTGTCFAETGNQVWCVDIDKEKIQALENGRIPIYEPELETMIQNNRLAGRLCFTTDISEALAVANICFIAVGTPMREDGGVELRYVMAVAHDIGRVMAHHVYVVNKSTVPVGTAGLVRAAVQGELEKRRSALTFDVISNPEFLKEGSAIQDCLKPDRVVVGVDNGNAASVMQELYCPCLCNKEHFVVMDIASAEMTKYAANAMLAARISFMNEVSNICEQVGADINKVRIGVGLDHRIGFHFNYPGCGYGGSCFPKDVRALIKTAERLGCQSELLQAVDAVNHRQKLVLVNKVKRRFGADLHGRVFAVWGLAFKPNTDDMRESPAIRIIEELTAAGAGIRAYDPQAMPVARNHYLQHCRGIAYCAGQYEALEGADALLLITEWKEFRAPDFSVIREKLKTSVIFDGRNQYQAEQLWEYGLEYEQIGVRKLERKAEENDGNNIQG
ncbi:MAG: UDP-glucose/GDP-mannose dehydrogenase family protein [Lachnospiraceae bacterium]|mgnify:CR=1 FL=1|nr:UDP-glucose/GDP-mannose dehydrogenase family protein [Lachnospiraceae bacterium]